MLCTIIIFLFQEQNILDHASALDYTLSVSPARCANYFSQTDWVGR
jgi:hypothetical protein